MVYTYDGSRRHTRIDDISTEIASIKDLGFKDAVTQAGEYTYRTNGQVIKDLNRGISAITYTSTGPLSKITYVNGTVTDYANARGTQEILYTSTNRGGGITELRDRVKGIHYVRHNGGAWDLDYIITEEGRVRRSGTVYTYEYDIRDHLGNTRVTVVDSVGSPRVAQLNSYYGFGMGMPGSAVDYTSSPKNNYLYNGKELVDDLGWYDYGARMYDPAIARWNTVDPLAENDRSWSPYNYVRNNPMRFIDPDGRQWADPKKDQEIADRLQKGISERLKTEYSNLNDANSRITKLEAKIKEDGTSKGLESRLASAKADEDAATGAISNLNASLKELTEMGSKDVAQKFTFNEISGGEMGGTEMKGGVITMDIVSDANGIHEAAHGYQIYNKTMSRDRYVKEVLPYQRQYSYNAASVSGLNSSYPGRITGLGSINKNWVSGIYDSEGNYVYSPGLTLKDLKELWKTNP